VKGKKKKNRKSTENALNLERVTKVKEKVVVEACGGKIGSEKNK